MKATIQTLICGLFATCAFVAPASAAPHTISWSGRVDDTVVVRIQSDHVRTRTVNGNSTSNVNVSVDEPLPDRPVHIWLSDIHGRGTVEVVREPSAENNYTAVIRINDPQGGADNYAFNVHWRSDRGHRGGYYGNSGR